MGSHGGLLLKFFQNGLGYHGNWIFGQTHPDSKKERGRRTAGEEAQRGVKKRHTPMRHVFPVHCAGQMHLKPSTRSTHTPLWLHGFGLQSSSSEEEEKCFKRKMRKNKKETNEKTVIKSDFSISDINKNGTCPRHVTRVLWVVQMLLARVRRAHLQVSMIFWFLYTARHSLSMSTRFLLKYENCWPMTEGKSEQFELL